MFKREVKSGIYSVHVYYLGNWLCKAICLSFHPVLLISILFPFLKLQDSSMENYLHFLRNG